MYFFLLFIYLFKVLKKFLQNEINVKIKIN